MSSETDELPNELSAVEQRVAQELQQRNNNLWRSNYHEAAIYIEEGLNNDKFENHPKKRARRAHAEAQGLLPESNPPSDAAAMGASTQGSASTSNNSSKPTKVDDESEQDKKHGFILGGQYTTIETYILVHNRYFYQLDMAASIVLLLLALIEPPAVDGYELNPKIHAAIEMFALGIIAIELLLKFRWMGPRRFFHHGRTVTKLVVLLLMNFEAIVIFLRHSTHARYSRALRPIFLIDNHYCHGLRRAVRQIFQSLPPIIDMFTLALFFLFVFSIFGFYLFAADNYYFSDMPGTIGNLLILATTANLPDVMMPSYAVSRWSAIFFVLFVVIHLFLLTNLTMAAVYEIFTRKEKEKFHKLLLHRRKACQQAFKLLVSRRQPTRIQYRQFMGLMRYLNRKCSMFDAYLIFKALDTDKNGSISLEEFYQIYDFINLEWKLIYPKFKWHDEYVCLTKFNKRVLILIERLTKNKIFEWAIDLLIIGQALMQFVEATALGGNTFGNSNTQTAISVTTSLNDSNTQNIQPDKISTHIFISVFLAEAALRCLSSGPSEYWRNKWNRFDLFVLATSIIGSVNGLLGGEPFGWVIVLRILRLMRLFEFKRRYRDLWQTLTYILMKRFVSMTCVVMIMYYFFAIIGMEILSEYDLRNCCQNSSIESQFRFVTNSSTLDNGLVRYYLNDFGDLIASYLTLFSMSSNTYWLTLMSAYTLVSGSNWVRLYFGLYYLCSIIVMNIVIAFILESFLFHIHYRNKMGDNCDDTNLFTIGVTLSSFEVDFLRETLGSTSAGSSSGAAVRSANKCVDQLDKTLAKMKRVNEQRASGWLNSCSSSNSLLASSSTLATKIIGDDYLDQVDEADERTCLLRAVEQQPKQRREPRKKLSNAGSKRVSPLALESCLFEQQLSGSAAAAAAAAEPSSGRSAKSLESREDESAKACSSKSALKGNQRASSNSPPPANCPRRPEFYLIYQAEQIRNKFSFTMKMYADEVESWLAEAERADRDAMSSMISRNQLRAEHVAMARLARRNLAELQRTNQFGLADHEPSQQQQHHHHHYLHQHLHTAAGGALDDYAEGSPSGPLSSAALLGAEWFRPRSYSSSAGAMQSQQTERARRAKPAGQRD